MLEELEAAYAAATPGEWDSDTDGAVLCKARGPYVIGVMGQHLPNARLIALMKNNLPALIECAEALGSLMRDTGLVVLMRPDQVRRASNTLAKLENKDA